MVFSAHFLFFFACDLGCKISSSCGGSNFGFESAQEFVVKFALLELGGKSVCVKSVQSG